MVSKTTVLCCVVMTVTMMCLLSTANSAPAPERPNRFDTIDDYMRYLAHVNSQFASKRSGQPHRPEQFEDVSDYLKYLTDLNSFMSNTNKRSGTS